MREQWNECPLLLQFQSVKRIRELVAKAAGGVRAYASEGRKIEAAILPLLVPVSQYLGHAAVNDYCILAEITSSYTLLESKNIRGRFPYPGIDF